MACESCDLWVLPRDAFERFGVVFPELPRIVRLVARQRLERMGVSLADISSDGDGSDAVRLLEDAARVAGRSHAGAADALRRVNRRRRCRRRCRRGVLLISNI